MRPTLLAPCKQAPGGRTDQGYGMVHQGGRHYYAHRVAYEQAHGPIPDGLELDHVCHSVDPSCAGGPTCSHRGCIELTHLEAVTRRTNVLRGRGPSAVSAAKTHCDNGHEFTEGNTYHRPDHPQQRGCRTCTRLRNRENNRRYRREGRYRKPRRLPTRHLTCFRGHPLTFETIRYSAGRRICRECHNELQRVRRAAPRLAGIPTAGGSK